jgi:hypothetical protein
MPCAEFATVAGCMTKKRRAVFIGKAPA